MRPMRDLAAIAAIALLTAWFAGSVMPPDGARAAGEEQAPLPPATAVLATEGVELRLAADPKNGEAGGPYVLELEARNTTDEARRVVVTARLSAVRPASPMARMLSLPVELWTEEMTLELEPGQRVTIPMATETEAPEGHEVRFALTTGGGPVRADLLPLAPLLPPQGRDAPPDAE